MGAVPLFFELTCESTYPIAEGVTNGFLTWLNNIPGLILLLVLMVPSIGTKITSVYFCQKKASFNSRRNIFTGHTTDSERITEMNCHSVLNEVKVSLHRSKYLIFFCTWFILNGFIICFFIRQSMDKLEHVRLYHCQYPHTSTVPWKILQTGHWHTQ